MPSNVQRKVVDLIVIGAGSGGLEAATSAAKKLHKRVAIVGVQLQHGPPLFTGVGGTCTSVGCVPEKLLAIGARFRDMLRDANHFGYDVGHSFNVPHSWEKLVEAKNSAISNLNRELSEGFSNAQPKRREREQDGDGQDGDHGEDGHDGQDGDGEKKREGKISFHQGWGRFFDKHTIEVIDAEDETTVREVLQAETILIATGAWPTVPEDIPGMKQFALTSNQVFYQPSLPKKILFFGGGYIAVELSSVLRSFLDEDAMVVLAVPEPRLLSRFDHQMAEALAEQMQNRGIQIRFSSKVTKVELSEEDNVTRLVTFDNGETQLFDWVISATGRHPNTDKLQLDKAGITLDGNGAIPVDKFCQTKVRNIYAVGDVTHRLPFTAVAVYEAKCFVSNLGGERRAVSHENIPTCVNSIPQLAFVGMTEEQAKDKLKKVAVYCEETTPLVHKLTGNEEEKCKIKMIADHETGKVVGVHILAGDAAEMIVGFAVALKAGATVQDFNDSVGLHPTVAESVTSLDEASYYYFNGEKRDKDSKKK